MPSDPFGLTIEAALLLVTLAGALGTWIAYRRSELRRDEVVAWVNKVIENMQTTVLLIGRNVSMPALERNERLRELGISASILLEQGRILFKNVDPRKYGSDKQPAYRGLRPMILDQVLFMHQLAVAWPTLPAQDHGHAFDIGLFSLRRFVSLAQQEVGRGRVASGYSKAQGSGGRLEDLLDLQRLGKPIGPELKKTLFGVKTIYS